MDSDTNKGIEQRTEVKLQDSRRCGPMERTIRVRAVVRGVPRKAASAWEHARVMPPMWDGIVASSAAAARRLTDAVTMAMGPFPRAPTSDGTMASIVPRTAERGVVVKKAASAWKVHWTRWQNEYGTWWLEEMLFRQVYLPLLARKGYV